MKTITLPILLAIFLSSACASTLPSRWDETDNAAVDSTFAKCKRLKAADEDFIMDCGLSMFSGSAKDAPHKAVVAEDIKVVLAEDLVPVTLANKVDKVVTWDGQEVQMTVAIFNPARSGCTFQRLRLCST